MTIDQKLLFIKEQFSSFKSTDDRICYLIQLGRNLPPYPEELKLELHRVRGCQSTLYLICNKNSEGRLFFQTDSDALVSKGLAALLISIYSGEYPETIGTTPPTFLSEFGILASLSPSRSNGLAHIYKKIREAALKEYLQQVTPAQNAPYVPETYAQKFSDF